MANAFLLETGIDRFLLEDGSGVLLEESATTFCCGFECALAAPPAAGTNNHLKIVNSAVTETVIVRTPGTRSVKVNPVAGAAYVQHDHGGTACVERFYVRYETLPTAVVRVAVLGGSVNSGYLKYQGGTTGQFSLRIDSGTETAGGPVIAVGTWYRIDVSYDVSADPSVLRAQVDGGTEWSVSFAQTPGTTTTTILGDDGSSTYTAYYDDWLSSQTTNDYPFGEGHVLGYVPSATGTFVQTAGDFVNQVPANVGTGDGSYVQLTDVPGDTTSYIGQAVLNTASYAEYIYGTSGQTVVPRAVEQVVGYFMASAAAGSQKAQLYDGTTAADAYVLTSQSNTAVNYISKQWASTPSGGIWTATAFQSLRIRWGFSDDVTPNPRLTTSILEAEFAGGAISHFGPIVLQAMNRAATR